jgi:hypothetical protein
MPATTNRQLKTTTATQRHHQVGHKLPAMHLHNNPLFNDDKCPYSDNADICPHADDSAHDEGDNRNSDSMPISMAMQAKTLLLGSSSGQAVATFGHTATRRPPRCPSTRSATSSAGSGDVDSSPAGSIDGMESFGDMDSSPPGRSVDISLPESVERMHVSQDLANDEVVCDDYDTYDSCEWLSGCECATWLMGNKVRQPRAVQIWCIFAYTIV